MHRRFFTSNLQKNPTSTYLLRQRELGSENAKLSDLQHIEGPEGLDKTRTKISSLNTDPWWLITQRSSPQLQTLRDAGQELNLPIKSYTLQYNFAVRKGARRYKKPRIKTISQKNCTKRVKYSKEYQDKTIYYFWKYIYFTDEAHFNSRDLVSKDEYILYQPDS